MRKITFIITLFYVLITYSQHTLVNLDIIDEQFDSNGCTTSVNLQFNLNHTQEILSGNPRKYTLFIKNSQGVTTKDIQHDINSGNTTTHTTGNILITSKTTVRIMEEYKGGGRRGGIIRPFINMQKYLNVPMIMMMMEF